MWSLVTPRCGGFAQRLCPHPRGSDDVLGQWLSAFRTARNERQKRKPVWEGGEAQDSARHTTKAEQRPSGQASAGRGELGSASTHRRSASLRAMCSLRLFTSVGRHVATHRLIVMPSAWVDRPPSVSIGGRAGTRVKKSENTAWWKGAKVFVEAEEFHVDTLYDVLDKVCKVPSRPLTAPMRMPISGIYKIKGVGDVLAGRVEQGIVKPGEEVIFLPTHTASNPCTGKVFTVEMHHQRVDQACPGDNVGLNIKGLDKNNMPRSGDVMVYKKDTTLGQTREFNAQIQVLDIPQRDQSGIFTNWFRAVRSRGVPYFRPQVEDGEGDGWKETRGSSLLEVERDGRVLLPAATAARLRHVQESSSVLLASSMVGHHRA